MGDRSQLRETQLNLAALLQKGDKRQNPFLFDPLASQAADPGR